MSEAFPKKIDKKFDVGFPPFFWFCRVYGCFSAMRVQKHNTKRSAKKNGVQKLYKKFDKKSKTEFFSIFLVSRFWAGLGEESSKKYDKKYRKNNCDPSPFLASDPPTHDGGHRFVFGGPGPVHTVIRRPPLYAVGVFCYL
jgi:hypothetical protein